MSGRIDTPGAIASPLPARPRRAELERSRTIWLIEPIDLRQAVERLESEAVTEPRYDGRDVARDEIARRLREPRRSR